MSTRRVHLITLLSCTFLPMLAFAAPSDPVKVYVGVGYGHDDNLLRVPQGQLQLDPTLADSWWQREVGVTIDKTFSRQRILLSGQLSKYDFIHFKQLNYDGKDLHATWFWELGNHLMGKLGFGYDQVLPPYTDFQSNERNLRRSHDRFIDGIWRFHSAWQLRAGLQRDTFSYELQSQRLNNRAVNASEVELTFLARSGSTIGIVGRHLTGSYPYLRPIDNALISDDFNQDELKAHIRWLATGSTSIEAFLGKTSRVQSSGAIDKTNVLTGRVKAAYQPRGALTYYAAAWRNFEPLESTLVNYSLNNGATIGTEWELTSKIKVSANETYEERNYIARTGSVALDGLRDVIRSTSLRATFTPQSPVTISGALVRDSRSGSLTLRTGSFRSTSFTLSARLLF